VAVFQQHVGRDDDPTVAGADHRGIVAGAEQGGFGAGKTGGDPLDQAELAQVRNCDDASSLPGRPRGGRTSWSSGCGRSTGRAELTTTCARFYRVTRSATKTTASRVAHALPWLRKDNQLMTQSLPVQAYILIQTEVGKAAGVAQQIASLPGVTSAEDVTGPYDVIVRAQAASVDELGKLVVARLQVVEGITRTLTCPVVHL
jgi:DNA-binding Lrp family transcriptional regulator